MTDTIPRQPRHRRRRGVTVQLTVRDEELLLALARFRLARTSDLLRYAFSKVRPDTAAARLRRLFDSRHLAVLPPELGSENIYRLGPAGRRYLAKQDRGAGPVPRGGLVHHLAIVQTWVAIAGLEEYELARCLPDWELRQEFSVAELPIVPDLFALIRTGSDVHPVAIEVDCGTESRAVVQRKVEQYQNLWGRAPGLFGWERFGLAIVCHGSSSRSVINAALKKAWVVPHVVWSEVDGPKSALDQLLSTQMAPLSSSPYRKGSDPGAGHECLAE